MSHLSVPHEPLYVRTRVCVYVCVLYTSGSICCEMRSFRSLENIGQKTSAGRFAERPMSRYGKELRMWKSKETRFYRVAGRKKENLKLIERSITGSNFKRWTSHKQLERYRKKWTIGWEDGSKSSKSEDAAAGIQIADKEENSRLIMRKRK